MLRRTLIPLLALVGCAGPEAGTQDPEGSAEQQLTSAFVVADVHGNVTAGTNTAATNVITLVDWEGMVANPAIKLFVTPPSGATFPLTATLSANNSRLYFNNPSTIGSSGPTKTLTFSSAANKQTIYLSIWPDQDALAENWLLTITAGAVTTKFVIKVVDQDVADAGVTTPITVDFSKDTTGFFTDAGVRAVTQQAAADWAAFFTDAHYDTVAVGTEASFIWDPSGYVNGNFVWNAYAYNGYLLYAAGMDQNLPDDQLRSGGAPSSSGAQTINGVAVTPTMRRSGVLEVEKKGNWNRLGWYVNTNDALWWQSQLLVNQPNDLYSVAHHEIGHAFFFNSFWGGFPCAANQNSCVVSSTKITAYCNSAYPENRGFCSEVDLDNTVDHMRGEWDPASMRGAFGNEYSRDINEVPNEIMPLGRWLPTKLDLLVAELIGYHLRASSAFADLTAGADAFGPGLLNQTYTATATATGGVPRYKFTLSVGVLPTGLTLDPFTGVISGVPRARGTFNFTVRVTDAYSTTRDRATRIIVN